MLRFFTTRDPDPRGEKVPSAPRSALAPLFSCCDRTVDVIVFLLEASIPCCEELLFSERTLRMMPISAQQWRVAVGKMNANKRCPEKRQKSSPAAPREGSPRKPSAREERREYVANLLTVLYSYFLALRSIVSDVFRSERDENEGSTKKMKAKGKGLHGSLVMLLRLLLFITALLLLMGGDVERNPGPPKRGELE